MWRKDTDDAATQVPTAAKVKALQRELALRRALYPKQVAAGTMKQIEADYQIEVLEAILADYLKLSKNDPTT